MVCGAYNMDIVLFRCVQQFGRIRIAIYTGDEMQTGFMRSTGFRFVQENLELVYRPQAPNRIYRCTGKNLHRLCSVGFAFFT